MPVLVAVRYARRPTSHGPPVWHLAEMSEGPDRRPQYRCLCGLQRRALPGEDIPRPVAFRLDGFATIEPDYRCGKCAQVRAEHRNEYAGSRWRRLAKQRLERGEDIDPVKHLRVLE
jgi:hypothetical protein